MRLQEGGYLPLQDDRAIVVFRQGSAAGLANRKQLGLLFWVQRRAKVPYEILVPDETRGRLAAYETSVRAGAQVPGQRTGTRRSATGIASTQTPMMPSVASD
jgi:hypothetical protein